MRIRLNQSDLSEQRTDLAVGFAYEGSSSPSGIADAALRRELAREMKAAEFRGRAGDRMIWSANGRYPARRFLVVGLGPKGNGTALRTACARAARTAQEMSSRSLSLRLPGRGDSELAEQARQSVEGVMLGAYRFERYLGDASRRTKALASLEIGLAGALAPARRAVRSSEIVMRAVCFARDLVNEAPSRLTPRALAREARKVARSSKLQFKVLGPVELRREGLGALLGVARGSAEPPRVVHLVHRPASRGSRGKAKGRRVLLVGKGVTFDSGGLNLKPGDSMLTMKCDMAGAAAVLAVMSVLREIDCGVEVHGLLGLTENMTGGAAYKPGDILETWSGKTVEIGNTDAEGRLVLCDLLAWGAHKIKPTEIIDVATLTGACVVALGLRAAGLFARDDDLGEDLLRAAGVAGEKVWPLPLYDDYLAQLQKGPADLRNVGSRWGGAITAALFLGEFVPSHLAWAHLDIAGPAFTEEDLPEAATGGTGAGVATLARWLEGA
jgi:leucyl aminopeptidase